MRKLYTVKLGIDLVPGEEKEEEEEEKEEREERLGRVRRNSSKGGVERGGGGDV